MDRHAGFAIVASISGGLIDEVAGAYARGLGGPTFFPAPDSITTPAGTVDFAGIFEMLEAHIELHPNPGDLVTVHFKFRSSLRARLSGVFNVWRRNDIEVSAYSNARCRSCAMADTDSPTIWFGSWSIDPRNSYF